MAATAATAAAALPSFDPLMLPMLPLLLFVAVGPVDAVLRITGKLTYGATRQASSGVETGGL